MIKQRNEEGFLESNKRDSHGGLKNFQILRRELKYEDTAIVLTSSRCLEMVKQGLESLIYLLNRN